MTQRRQLAKPYPKDYIRSNPSGGGEYVAHSVVKQHLLMVLGSYDFTILEELYEDLPAIPPNPQGTSKRAKAGSPALPHCLVGVKARLSVVVDGVPQVVEDIGDCEDPRNWPHNGARGKDAASDAFKRCAMHLGDGMHLWAQNYFFLYDALVKREQASRPDGGEVADGNARDSQSASPDAVRAGHAK